MKWLIRKEVLFTLVLEADDEEAALAKAADTILGKWMMDTMSEEIEETN